ncbi:MAG: glycosyltransferase, partial [Alphaproteobacteria bacterium]|nr:glycosyltransferase [Alphaproteobacteria bacterium]
VLSICIPTYNRSTYLSNTLAQLTKESLFLNTNDVEIVISDNCSNDDTEDVCRHYKEKFGDKIIYYKQKENIRDKNFAFAISLANGKYAKLNNDNLFFKSGELEKFVSFLKSKEAQDIVLLPNTKTDEKPYVCNTFNELLDKVSYGITWIGALCVKTSAFKELKEPDRYAHLCFCQVDIIARLMQMNKKASVYPYKMFDSITLSNKGGYSIPEVFGHNYLSIIKEIYEKGDISPCVYRRHKKRLLLKHINKFSFNQKNTCFSKEGYFKYLLPYYWKNMYFYLDIIRQSLKKCLRCIFEVKDDKRKNYKTVKILCFKIKLPKKKTKNKWVRYNCPPEKVRVGRYTYGTINAQFNENRSEKLIVGDFCSIGPNVNFLVSSEHPYKGISTYPFKVRICGCGAEATSKGDIVVKDDVWIGLGSIICSGVTIGQGAIIAAGSVVVKDVPPYAIVGGNPAKVIKYRFDEEVVRKLSEFDFSTLTEEKIKRLQGALYKEVTKENIDTILEDITQGV